VSLHLESLLILSWSIRSCQLPCSSQPGVYPACRREPPWQRTGSQACSGHRPGVGRSPRCQAATRTPAGTTSAPRAVPEPRWIRPTRHRRPGARSARRRRPHRRDPDNPGTAAPCPDTAEPRRPAGADGPEQPSPRSRLRGETGAGPGGSRPSSTPHHAGPRPGWSFHATRTIWSRPTARSPDPADSNGDSNGSDHRPPAATGDGA
jgi:hypothetical protein